MNDSFVLQISALHHEKTRLDSLRFFDVICSYVCSMMQLFDVLLGQ